MENGYAAERMRRRQISILLAAVGIPVISLFSVIDFLEGARLELFVDLVLIAVLLVALVAIFRHDQDRQAYLIGLNVISLGVLYNVSLGAGNESALYWVFVLPLLLFFFLGRRDGLFSLLIVIAGMALLLFLPDLLHTYDYGLKTGLRFSLSFLFVAVVGYGLESSRDRFSRMLQEEQAELLHEKADLEEALLQIKTLHGLLPICASCKKIRDDRGYWQQIESYLYEHADARFSHGICPDCAKKLYPGLKVYDETGEQGGA